MTLKRAGKLALSPLEDFMDDFDWQLISFDPPKPELKADDKGACPKCGKHIGKGVHFHVKVCNGHPGKAR